MVALRAVPWAFLLLIGLLCAATRGPRGSPGTADEAHFDGARAVLAMDVVIGSPAQPRPVGSDEHTAVRARLVEALRVLGLQPDVQSSETCRGSRCLPVHNVFAELEPGRPGPLDLLVAHYDSVPTGPGVADDGSGVGILLEAVRAAQVRAPGVHPMAVLFTDAEEVGLLGAEAFAASPMMDRVRSVVNVEARGTHGQSYLFQTSSPGGRLSRIASRAVPNLRASSLFVEVYRRLPNDTDLTVFLEHPVAAANFAFLAGVEHYHRPTDDRAHLDVRSVHMQGHQAFELWWALAQSDDLLAGGDDVYADVLGLFWLRWPAAWAVPLALLVLLGVGGVAWGAPRRWGVVWALVGAAGVLVSATVPGASYLFVGPAAWAALWGGAGVAFERTGRGPGWPWALGGCFLGTVLWLELAIALPDALASVWWALPPALVAIAMMASVWMAPRHDP